MRMRAALLVVLLAAPAWAGPETALREFASSQVKKGVRVLGMGGDGATQGNYGLVWRGASTAVADYGITHFADTGNDVHFVALGFTTPRFWRKAALYLVVIAEWGSQLKMHLASPAFSRGADFAGEGSDQSVFAKLALPLGHGFSFGLLLGWERSAMTAIAEGGVGTLSYTTTYLPSAGAGLAWANRWLLVGVRALTNNDWETRTDALGPTSGWLGSLEVRAGASVRVWRGGLFDAGYAGLWRVSQLAGTSRFTHALTAGFEQHLGRYVAVRAGWDESSPTAGMTLSYAGFNLHAVYVHDLGVERTGAVFGHQDHAVIVALTYDYARRR